MNNNNNKVKIGRIVFVRHGESVWNTNPVRFTGIYKLNFFFNI